MFAIVVDSKTTILKMAKHTVTTRQREWVERIRTAQASGQSLADYARSEGIKLKSLYQWKTRLTKLGLLESPLPASDFVAVKPKRANAITPSSYAVVFPNGLRVEVQGELTPAVLSELVHSTSGLD